MSRNDSIVSINTEFPWDTRIQKVEHKGYKSLSVELFKM